MSREQILHELSETLDRAKEKLDALEPESKEIYVFGAGNTARLYRNGFATENIHPKAYLDNDPNKQGKKFFGVDVIDSENVADKKRALVLICSLEQGTNAAVIEKLERLGMAHLNIDAYIFARHRTEIMQCAEHFVDDESAAVYAKMIELRMAPERVWIKRGYGIATPLSGNKYFAFPPFMFHSKKEVFVDLGAYVGDTLEQYILVHDGNFEKIYLFEPDAKNFKALNARSRRLIEEWALDKEKIRFVEAGVGGKTKRMRVHQSTFGVHLINDDDNVENDGDTADVFALDDYFADQRITFLKSDIESAEFDMLHGAERIIRRDRPKMALCIYHNAYDMFRIQQWLESLKLGYNFAVRHHSYRLSETVLYAWQ